MSPLWPNQLLVSMSTEQVAAIYRTGLTKRILNQKNAVLAEPNQATSSASWQTSLAHLDTLISSLQPSIHSHLQITIASDLVRYLTLPPQQIMLKPSENLAYASAAYREIYGTSAGEWLIKCHSAAPGKATITSAVDQAFFNAIQTLATKHKLKLNTVQPYLMTVFNRLHSQVDQSNGLLTIVEPNRLVLVNLKNGQGEQVRNLKLGDDWQNTLNQTLTRETLLGDIEQREVFIYAPSQKNTTVKPAQGWHIKKVTLAGVKHNLEKPYTMLETFA